MKKLLKMRKKVLTIVAALVVGVICIVSASAEEEPEANLSVAALSQYIWRGQELSKDSMVLQPSMTVGYKGFSANLWSNLDPDPYTASDDPANWTETDFTLSYSTDLGPLSVEGGYIYYGLDAAEDSQEIYVGLGLDTLLSPTLTVYRDYDTYRAWYILFGISHAFEITEGASLELSGSVSYLKGEDVAAYPEYNDSGTATSDKFNNFHDGVISASLPIAVDKYVTVTPLLIYTFPLSDDAGNDMEARSIDGNNDSFIYGGVTVSMAF